jgi:hypothetical protein
MDSLTNKPIAFCETKEEADVITDALKAYRDSKAGSIYPAHQTIHYKGI